MNFLCIWMYQGSTCWLPPGSLSRACQGLSGTIYDLRCWRPRFEPCLGHCKQRTRHSDHPIDVTDVPESPPTTWTLNLPDTSLRCSAKKLSTGANGQTENAASPLSALRRFWSSCHWQPARPPALSERPRSVSSQFKFVQVAYHINKAPLASGTLVHPNSYMNSWNIWSHVWKNHMYS